MSTQRRTLHLNTDGLPLLISDWQSSIRLLFRNAGYPILAYEDTIRGPHIAIQKPSVIIHRRYHKTNLMAKFTRENVLLNYMHKPSENPKAFWTCALCGEPLEKHDLTFDHLIPRCEGGISEWKNILLAHSSCNQKKGYKSLRQAGMKLHVPIRVPLESDINRIRIQKELMREASIPEGWADFLSDSYWNSELEA